MPAALVRFDPTFGTIVFEQFSTLSTRKSKEIAMSHADARAA
jgi:hypothetical protein